MPNAPRFAIGVCAIPIRIPTEPPSKLRATPSMRILCPPLALVLLFAVSASSGAEHTKDSLDTVRQNLAEKKAILIDVREQKECEQGHLADARLLSLSEL